MAKKESKDIDLDLDFGMDDDFDMNFDSEFSSESKAPKNRSAVGEVFSGTISGMKSKFTDPSFMGETVRKSFPASYDTAFDTANKVVSTGRDIYDEAVKELKPHVGSIAKSVDRMIPESLGIVKRTTSKIDKFFNGEEAKQTNKVSYEDQLVGNTLTSVFGQQHELAKQERAEDRAQSMVKDRIEDKRFKASHGLMGRISDNIDRLTTTKQTVDLAYQKKSLELQVRSLFALQNLADKTIKFQEVATTQNESIVKNTALPEFVKLRDSERFKELAKNKFMGGVQSGLMNVTGVDKMLASIKKDASEYIGGWKQGLGMGADGLEAIREQLELMDSLNDPEAGFSISKKEMLGQMAGGALAGKARDKLTGILRKMLSENSKVEGFGHQLSAIMANPGAFAKEYKNSDKFQEMLYSEGINGWGGKILEYILSKAKDDNGMDLKFDGGRVDTLKDAAVFTNKFVRSVEEVIPTWLANIHHELVKSNTPDGLQAPEPARFDFKSGTVVSKHTARKEALSSIDKAKSSSMYNYNVSGTYDKLVDGAQLQPEHKEEIEKFIMRFSREKDVRFVQEDIVGSKAFKSLSKDAQRVLFSATENLSKEDDSLERKKKEAELSRSLHGIRTSTTDFRASIEEQILNNNVDVLIEDGIVRRLDDGSLTIDEDKYMERVESGYFGTSDRNKKKNINKFGKKLKGKLSGLAGRFAKSDVDTKESIRPADMESALDKIRKTDVYTWNYKDGEGDSNDHIGPMAQDVRKNMGDATAPGGKKIDLVNLNGLAMAAIQELADKVDSVTSSEGLNSTLLETIAGNTARTAELLESKQFMKLELPEDFLSKIGSSISDSVHNAFASAKDKTKGISSKILDGGKKAVNRTTDIAGRMGKAGWNGITGVGKWGKDTLVDPALNYLNDPATKQAITDSIGSAFRSTMELGSTVIGQVKKTITERIPNGLNFVKDKLRALGSVLYDGIIGPVDIFIKGNLEPVIQASKMRAGEYYDDATGKIIRTVKDIEEARGNICNKAGEVVMTISQKTEGMFDGLGKRLQSKAVTAIQTATHIGSKFLGTAFKVTKNIGKKIGDTLGLTDGRFGELADRVSESIKDTFGDGIGLGISKEADTAIQDVRDLLYRVYPEEAESVEANKKSLKGDSAKRDKGIMKSLKDFLKGKDKVVTTESTDSDSPNTSSQDSPGQSTTATTSPVSSQSSSGGVVSGIFSKAKNAITEAYAEHGRDKLNPNPEREGVSLLDRSGVGDIKGAVKTAASKAADKLPIESLRDYSNQTLERIKSLNSDEFKTTEIGKLANNKLAKLKDRFSSIKGMFSKDKEPEMQEAPELAGPMFKGNKVAEWVKGKYDPVAVRNMRDRVEGIPLFGDSLAAGIDRQLLGKDLNQERKTLGQKFTSMKSSVGNFFSNRDPNLEMNNSEATATDIIAKYKDLPNSTLGKFLSSNPGKRFLKAVNSAAPGTADSVARSFLGNFKDKRYLEAFERGKENVEKEWRGEPVEEESLMDRLKAGAGKGAKLLGNTKLGKGAKFLGNELGMIGRSAAEIGGHLGKAGLNAMGVSPDAVADKYNSVKNDLLDRAVVLKDKAVAGMKMAKDDISAKGRSVYNQALFAGAMLGDKYDSVKESVKEKLAPITDKVSSIKNAISDSITSRYGDTIDSAKEKKNAVVEKIKGLAKSDPEKGTLGTADKLKLTVAHAADTLSDKLSPYTDKVKGAYEGAKTAVTDKVDVAKQKAKDFGNEFLENSPETKKLIEHWAPRVSKSKDYLKEKKAKAGDFVGDLTKRMGLEIAKDKVMDVKDRLLDKLGKKAKDTSLGQVVEDIADDVAVPDTDKSVQSEYSQTKGSFGSKAAAKLKGFFGGNKNKVDQAEQAAGNAQQANQQGQQQPNGTEGDKPRGLMGTMFDKTLGRSKFGRKIGGVASAIGGSKLFQGAKGLVGGVLGGLLGATGTDTGGNNNDNIQQGAQMADYNANLSVDTSKGPSFNDKDGDGRRSGSWEDKYAKMEQEKRDRRKTNVLAKADTKYKSNQNIIDKMMGAAQGIVDNVAAIGGGLMEAAGDLFGGGDKKGGKPGRGAPKGGKPGKFAKLKGLFSRGGSTAGASGATKVAANAGRNSLLKGSFGKVPGIATAATIGLGAYGVYASESSDMSRDEKDLATGDAVGSTGGALVGMAAGAKVGALAGTVLGPVGSMAGGLIGGTVGAIAGSSVGSKAGKWLGSKWTSIRKSFGSDNVSDYDMIRVYQYGLGHTEESKEHIGKITLLEEYLTDKRTGYNGTEAYLIESKMTNEELLEIMEIDPANKPAVAAFTTWFLERFKPIYLHHASILAEVSPKTKLSRLNTMKDAEKKKYLEKASFESAPYGVQVSPFKGLTSLNISKEYSGKMVEKLLKETKSDKEKEKLAPPMVPTGKDPKEELKAQVKEEAKKEEASVKKAIAPLNSSKDAGSIADGLISSSPTSATNKSPNTGESQYNGEDGVTNELAGGSKPTESGSQAGTGSFPQQPPIPSATGALKDGSGASPFLKFNGSKVKIDSMNPTMKQRFLGMVQEYGETTGKSVLITSGTRTSEEQARLFKELGPAKAARPGRSLHEFGLAIDVNSPDNAMMDKLGLMRKYGFTRPVGGETWHVEPAGIQGRTSVAKSDPVTASKMVAQGEGLGGGGIGSIKGTRLGSRDPEAAKKLMEATAKVVVPEQEAVKDPSTKENALPPAINTAAKGGNNSSLSPSASGAPKSVGEVAEAASATDAPDAGAIANALINSAPTAAVNKPALPDLGEPEAKPDESRAHIDKAFAHLPEGRKEDSEFDISTSMKREQENRGIEAQMKIDSRASHAKRVAELDSETPEEREARLDRDWKKLKGIYDEELTAGNTANGTVATPEVTKVDSVPEPVTTAEAPSSLTSGESGKYGQVKSVITEGAKKVGMDPGIMQAVAAVESSLNPNAAAKSSSAKGLFQFLNATWKEQIGKHGKKYGLHPGTSALDPFASTVMAGEYFKSNLRTIKGLKPNPTPTDAYLTHFLGPGGAHRFLKAGKDELGSKVLPNAAKSNPGIFKNANGQDRTIGEIYASLNDKISKKARAFGISANVNDMFPSGKTESQENVDKVTTMTGSIKPTDYTGTGQPVAKANTSTEQNTNQAGTSTSSSSQGMMSTSFSAGLSHAKSEEGPPVDRAVEPKSSFKRFDPIAQTEQVDRSVDPTRTSAVESQLGSLVNINQQHLDISTQLLEFMRKELPKLAAGQASQMQTAPTEDTVSKSGTRTASASSSSNRRTGSMPNSEINLGRRSAQV